MKNIVLFMAVMATGCAFGQISTNYVPQDTSTDQNVFMDAASNFNYSANSSHSIGKGLGFPQTDLSKFNFITTNLDGVNYPTFFDGLIVYNIADGENGTGSSTNDPILTSQTTNLKKGFYYFYNPKGEEIYLNEGDVNKALAGGKWVRIGDDPSASVAGANVATGTFTHAGGIKAVLGDNVPTDLKAITGIKIVRVDDNGAKLEGGVAATTFYSYDKATRTISFGQGVMATSMPKGEYRYTIEYTK